MYNNYNPYNGYNFNPYNNVYNQLSQQYNAPNQTLNNNTLPPQQIIQVNGKASVDTIQLAPNSSILLMDTSAPVVWLCTSDGVGKVTSTPYDITPHETAPPVDNSLEKRIENLEKEINNLKGALHEQSNVDRAKQEQTGGDNVKYNSNKKRMA